MKFSVIGDLHGNIIYLRYILRKIKKTDALFITGDIAGTLSYSLILKSILKSKKISREKYAELVYGRYREQFNRFQIKSALKIFKILSRANIPVFFTHGNSDSKEVLEMFRTLSFNEPLLNYLGNSIIENKELLMVGYGFCSPAEYRTPFQTPGEKEKNKIYQDLVELEKKILMQGKDKNKILIGLFHEPPKGSKLDYIAKKSTHSGSELIRNHIKNIHYEYVFTGHIHESQNYEIQNKTILVNPGALINRKWAIVDVERKSVSLKKIPIFLSIKGIIYHSREIFR